MRVMVVAVEDGAALSASLQDGLLRAQCSTTAVVEDADAFIFVVTPRALCSTALQEALLVAAKRRVRLGRPSLWLLAPVGLPLPEGCANYVKHATPVPSVSKAVEAVL